MTSAVRPSLRLLSEQDADRIVSEACQVLETAGVLVENEEARGLLGDAGASEHEGRWRIPEKLAREAVRSAPSTIRIYDRQGELAMDLGGDRVHFDPGSAAIHLFDLAQGGRRDVTTADAVTFARLVDGLPHYAAQSTAVAPADVPKAIGDR